MFKQRIKKIQIALKTKHLGALWISNSVNIRYISGFHMPEDAKILISSKNAYLFTDFRYQNEQKNFPDFEMIIWGGAVKAIDAVSGALKKERVRKLGFESEAVTIGNMNYFLKKLKCTLVPTERIIEELRIVKDADELKQIKKACAITDEAFRSACTFLRPGKTEHEVAWHIESFMRTHGAEALAFDCIIASGPNGDKPHAVPSKRKIRQGDFVTIDIGARVNGYHADMTRTVAVGFASDALKPIYEIVRRAQEAGLTAVQADVAASEIDLAARSIIAKEGYGEFFGHATGHGVGLEIHEAPSVSHVNETKLREGMVITVEPGIYVPGQGGVRIEDTVLVTKKGHKLLTHSPKVLCVV